MKSLRIRTKMSQQEVSVIYYQGQMVPFLIRAGKIVYAKNPIPIPDLKVRLVTDVEGKWMEVGFLSAVVLDGNPADGWIDAGEYVAVSMQNSFDLVNWSDGNWIAAPSGAVVNNGDGTYWYWSRCLVPQYWKNLIVDKHVGSDRYGKSISQIKIANAVVSLPGYPYAMPSQAAALQAALQTAGWTGATVTTSAAAMSVSIINYYYANSSFNRDIMQAVINGSAQVTEVSQNGVTIPLPSYPYQMPAAQATLQTDLRAAGYSGAVVKLFADPWEITIPNRATTTTSSRAIMATITPGDPYPDYNAFGTYLGLNQDNLINGTYDNIRSAGGVDRVEADKQFARLRIDSGLRWGAVGNVMLAVWKLIKP